jgi:predicted amidophosphoribosyltransferase
MVLPGFTRVPVCGRCLAVPTPLAADYFCVTCRTPFQNRFPLDEQGRCRLCRSGTRDFDAAYCFGAYEGTLRELIHLFKYGGMKPLGRTLGSHLASALPRDQQFDLVVPIPLHWRRQWQRGFNPIRVTGPRHGATVRGSERECGAPHALYRRPGRLEQRPAPQECRRSLSRKEAEQSGRPQGFID